MRQPAHVRLHNWRAKPGGRASGQLSACIVCVTLCVQKMVNQTRLAMNAIGKKGRLAGIVMMLVSHILAHLSTSRSVRHPIMHISHDAGASHTAQARIALLYVKRTQVLPVRLLHPRSAHIVTLLQFVR